MTTPFSASDIRPSPQSKSEAAAGRACVAAERARLEAERARVTREEGQLARNRRRVDGFLKDFGKHHVEAVTLASLEDELKAAVDALASAKGMYDLAWSEPLYRAVRCRFLQAETEHARLTGVVDTAKEAARLARQGSTAAAGRLADYLGTNRAVRGMMASQVGANSDPAANPVDLSGSPLSASDAGGSNSRIKRRGSRGAGGRRSGGKRCKRGDAPWVSAM